MSKFTKGPWNVTAVGDKSIRLDQWNDLNPTVNDDHYSQINSDARLIAAAPEMLEAIEAQLRGDGLAYEMMREALAKARGESHE